MSRNSNTFRSRSIVATNKTRINVIYYSVYGHVAKLAQSIVKGVEKAGGQARLIQIRGSLSEQVQNKSIPIITYGQVTENTITIEDAFTNCDGILFGYPAYFGGMPAQVKTLWDATASLWKKGALIGKPISIFFSTSAQNGGQETIVLTSLTNFIHHSMIIVPIGYSSPLLGNMNEIHGGSAYGAGTLSGIDGTRQPSQLELELAEHQGSHFTKMSTVIKLGQQATSPPKQVHSSDRKQINRQSKK